MTMKEKRKEKKRTGVMEGKDGEGEEGGERRQWIIERRKGKGKEDGG